VFVFGLYCEIVSSIFANFLVCVSFCVNDFVTFYVYVVVCYYIIVYFLSSTNSGAYFLNTFSVSFGIASTTMVISITQYYIRI